MVRSQALKTYLQHAPSSLQVVSFDVFDTLLVRLVPSERVIQMAAENLCNLLGKPTLVPVVVQSRREFGQRIRKLSVNGEAEWALSEWLKDLARAQQFDYSRLLPLGRQAELSAEINSLRLADEAVEALSIVKEQGLHSIAISDMWLDQAWLKELLERFGLVFDEVFSSGTIKHSKDKGTIFKPVETIVNCGPGGFLHVGDSLKADFLRPRLNGWKSIWMPRDYQPVLTQMIPQTLKRAVFSQEKYQEILQSIRIPHLAESSDPYFRLAYDFLSPLLIIFSLAQWRRFLQQDIDVAFYMARDAGIMLEVYNAIADLLPRSCPRHYIRLSRRAVALVHPDNLCQNVIPVAGKVGQKTVAEWLDNFTLDDELRQRILSDTGLFASTPFSQTSRRALRLACRKYQADIARAQRDLRAKIKDYLAQQTGTQVIRRIGIVDSGCACTIQDTLRGVADHAELISGVYLGVSRQGHALSANNQKYGLLRDDFRNRPYQNPLEASAGVIRTWETLFREPVGSVRRLARRADRQVEPVLDDASAIGRLEREAAQAIRDGILMGTQARRRGVALLAKLSDRFSDRDIEMAAAVIASKISTRPTRQMAAAILRLSFDDKGQVFRLGLSGVKHGVVWYPGMLACLGFGWLAPILKHPARTLRWAQE